MDNKIYPKCGAEMLKGVIKGCVTFDAEEDLQKMKNYPLLKCFVYLLFKSKTPDRYRYWIVREAEAYLCPRCGMLNAN